MKSYLTEADSAADVAPSHRQPFKLLQNLQHCHSSLKSKMAASSSALKSITNRQKRTDNTLSHKSTKLLESDFSTPRHRTPSLSSRQKNLLNAKAKITTGEKSKELSKDSKSNSTDSANGNSVGSLTSSPKWSHIKNKFENGPSIEKNKLGRTTSLNSEENGDNNLQSCTSKSLNSLHDGKLSISKSSNSCAKRSEMVPSVIPTKFDYNLVPKIKELEDSKVKSNSKGNKGTRDKSSSKTNSQFNSFVNTSRNIAPSSKSLRTSLNVPIAKTSGVSPKTVHLHKSLGNSSVSLSSNSSKNSENDDTLSVSSNMSYNSPLSSLGNIPSACAVGSVRSNSPKTLSNIPRSRSPKTVSSNNLSANTSALHSALTKRNLLVNRTSATNKLSDSKTRLDVNSSNKNNSPLKEPIKKSLFSEKDRILLNNISNINRACKVASSSANKIESTTSDKCSIAENVEKIRDLVKCSQPSSKTIWIKDNGGNWIKKNDTEIKNEVQNKVANLRNKFLEETAKPPSPLSKSTTSSNVPAAITTQCRPLAKSSTTSSICETSSTRIDCEKTAGLQSIGQENCNGHLRNSKPSQSNVTLKRNSVDSNAKLNIVQRAILSYEGNLALLSPETQRRLKLVNDKVKAQTDDGKILRANGSKWSSSPNKNDHVSKKTQLNSQAKSVMPTTPKESLQSARDFINRQQLKNKDTRNSCPPFVKKAEAAKNLASTSALKSKILGELKKEANISKNTASESIGGADKSIASVMGQSKQNMILNLSKKETSPKSLETNGDGLQPNSSFLWRSSTAASSDFSRSNTTSTVSLTSSDYRNYYDVQNYYSTLDIEIEKRSEEPTYIDSQESNSSGNYSSGVYENISSDDSRSSKNYYDLSQTKKLDQSSLYSDQSSTVRRKKTSHRFTGKDKPFLQRSQNVYDLDEQPMNDTISFTDSNDTLINDETGNESVFDLSDANHFYEPVYESLGNYLRDDDEPNDDNCSVSLSPDEADIMQCSLTSLESAESSKQDAKEGDRSSSKNSDKSNEEKKSGNKISQLKRHLSWTKNDIRLELSSKFNKIKIKKNGQNSTEIGVKVQEDSANTSPKKNTFIKCILRQKSTSSIPVKRSPSPKKESALFYVHLSMGQENRPCSDSILHGSRSIENGAGLSKSRKHSESALLLSSNNRQQRPRFRRGGPTVQRPKTPPPLPPTASKGADGKSNDQRKGSTSTLESSCGASESSESHLYTCLDPDYFETGPVGQSTFYTSAASLNSERITRNLKSSDDAMELNLPAFPKVQSELLKSPFEEEPLYQFYQKDVQQRATLWYTADGSESDFEDDASSKFSDTDSQPPSRPPVLQSQMSAMDLVHGEGGQRTLWCEVPEVIESGILKRISAKDRKIQEAMFEVITSEASYLKSLNFLFEHFVQCPEFDGTDTRILDKREKHILFSDIQPVRDVSARLLGDLEKRWLENILLDNICDIVYHHASKFFSVYVKYCSNQLYQDRLLRELKEKRSEFVTVLKRLESNVVCQGLDMHSFLMLPMQRITRLPLLIDAIFHRLSTDLPMYESCKMALATVNKLVAECNEGARKMERMEEMLVISQQLDFKDCKGLGLLSASRWLVKKGELVQLLLDTTSRRTFGRSSRWCKIQLYLFLFTDLLVVTRKKSDDSYSVVDFCPRNMLQVLSVDETLPPFPVRLPSSYRNLFQLIMLNNKEGKTVEMLLSCLLESDRTRWMDAMTPAKSENPDEKIYEEWDCPQFQCTHAYIAQQPDELSLEEADVVSVLRKMSDGWLEGERIRDGVRGWFPSSHAVEIITSHVRARNLRQRYRLLMLSQTYLEEQYKAQAAQAKK